MLTLATGTGDLGWWIAVAAFVILALWLTVQTAVRSANRRHEPPGGDPADHTGTA